MKRFTCENIDFGRRSVVECEAKSADDAAEKRAKATHSAYWAEKCRDGSDGHGSYVEYAIHITAARLHGTVRVYENYKY